MSARNKPEAGPKRAAHDRDDLTAPEQRIGFLIHDVSRMRRTLFDQAMRPLGITRSQWWALANLSRHPPQGMTQTELAKLMEMGKAAIVGLVDRLEASGHVERRPDPVDRRANRIFITEGGYTVLEKMMAVGHDLDKTLMRGVSPEARKTAEEVLHAMKDNIRQELE